MSNINSSFKGLGGGSQDIDKAIGSNDCVDNLIEEVERVSLSNTGPRRKQVGSDRLCRVGSKKAESEDDNEGLDVSSKYLSPEDELMATLSEYEKRTVNDLKDLQEEYKKIHSEYIQEWYALKARYELFYAPIYKRRKERLLVKSDQLEEQDDDEAKSKGGGVFNGGDAMLSLQKKATERRMKGTPALPGFWLACLKNNSMLAGMVEKHDEPILECLQDITSEWVDSKKQDSYILYFHFSKDNGYFTPNVLEKRYNLAASDPATEDAILVSAEATEIKWNEGKDTTKKKITKTQQHKRTKQKRVVTEYVDVASFFNFFKSHEIPSEDELQTMHQEDVEELEDILEADFAAGVIIRDKIIPNAISWFLGEGEDEDDEEEDDDEDLSSDEDEEDISDDEEEDEDEDDEDEEQYYSKGRAPLKSSVKQKTLKKKNIGGSGVTKKF